MDTKQMNHGSFENLFFRIKAMADDMLQATGKIESNISSLSNNLKNMSHLFNMAQNRCLLLMDTTYIPRSVEPNGDAAKDLQVPSAGSFGVIESEDPISTGYDFILSQSKVFKEGIKHEIFDVQFPPCIGSNEFISGDDYFIQSGVVRTTSEDSLEMFSNTTDLENFPPALPAANKIDATESLKGSVSSDERKHSLKNISGTEAIENVLKRSENHQEYAYELSGEPKKNDLMSELRGMLHKKSLSETKERKYSVDERVTANNESLLNDFRSSSPTAVTIRNPVKTASMRRNAFRRAKADDPELSFEYLTSENKPRPLSEMCDGIHSGAKSFNNTEAFSREVRSFLPPEQYFDYSKPVATPCLKPSDIKSMSKSKELQKKLSQVLSSQLHHFQQDADTVLNKFSSKCRSSFHADQDYCKEPEKSVGGSTDEINPLHKEIQDQYADRETSTENTQEKPDCFIGAAKFKINVHQKGRRKPLKYRDVVTERNKKTGEEKKSESNERINKEYIAVKREYDLEDKKDIASQLFASDDSDDEWNRFLNSKKEEDNLTYTDMKTKDNSPKNNNCEEYSAIFKSNIGTKNNGESKYFKSLDSSANFLTDANKLRPPLFSHKLDKLPWFDSESDN